MIAPYVEELQACWGKGDLSWCRRRAGHAWLRSMASWAGWIRDRPTGGGQRLLRGSRGDRWAASDRRGTGIVAAAAHSHAHTCVQEKNKDVTILSFDTTEEKLENFSDELGVKALPAFKFYKARCREWLGWGMGLTHAWLRASPRTKPYEPGSRCNPCRAGWQGGAGCRDRVQEGAAGCLHQKAVRDVNDTTLLSSLRGVLFVQMHAVAEAAVAGV